MNTVEKILQQVKNKQKHDKANIAYMIGMMDGHTMVSIYYESYLRGALIDIFTVLINNPKNLQKLNNGYCFKEIFADAEVAPTAKVILPKGKVVKQNSTHVAIQEVDRIVIYTKGLIFDDVTINPERLFSIKNEEKDDLLAYFEQFDENNRVNVAEYKEEIAVVEKRVQSTLSSWSKLR